MLSYWCMLTLFVAKRKKGRPRSVEDKRRSTPSHIVEYQERQGMELSGKRSNYRPKTPRRNRSLCEDGFAEGPLYPLRRGIFKSAREGDPGAAWERAQSPPPYITRCWGAMCGRRRHERVGNDGRSSPTHARPWNTRRSLAWWLLQPSRSERRPERRPAAIRWEMQGPNVPMDGWSLSQALCEVATTGPRGRRDPCGVRVQRAATNALGVRFISQTPKGTFGE